MKKTTYLNRLLRMTELHEMWPINPESPLLLFKNSQKLSTVDGIGILSNLLRKDQETELHPLSSLQSAQHSINLLKQEMTKPLSKVSQDNEHNRKQMAKKYQPKRIKTVPTDAHQRNKMSEQPHSVQIKPALLIREIKPKSSTQKPKPAKSEELTMNKTLEEISVQLHYPFIISHQNTAKASHHENLQQSLKEGPGKMVNDFGIPNLPNRNKSINIKKLTCKVDQHLHQKGRERKIISLSYGKPFDLPRNVTAKSYIIYRTNEKNGSTKVIISENGKNRQEIASLTKIMTAIVVIELCKRFSVDKYAEEVIITPFQSRIGGTSASLKDGQIYTIDQLLYGLMLPSGNDSSLALATWAGSKLLEDASQNTTAMTFTPQKTEFEAVFQQTPASEQTKQRCYRRFIEEMNLKARSLKMKRTNYANSHGLSNAENKSCVYDLALLCQYCMKNHTFRNIVNSQHYSGDIKSVSKEGAASLHHQRRVFLDQLVVARKHPIYHHHLTHYRKEKPKGKTVHISWQNTHDLLQKYPEEYIGIKTGFTYTAGPCLASCISHQSREYIIIVLGCESLSMRFRDTQALKKWCLAQQSQKQNCRKSKPKSRQRMVGAGGGEGE